MITNSNASKDPSEGSFIEVKKYMGVGSVNVLAINPSNAKLRQYGWTIPETQEEPKYVVVDGEGKKSARIRFLVQIQDLAEKPIVAMDFWIRPDVTVNNSGDKAKVIDKYGRTAWGTKEEIKAHKVPKYESGPASIAVDYKMCHVGEEELVNFLMKYLNVTPLQVFKNNMWVTSKDPGTLTIDNWGQLCEGNVSELVDYVSRMPDNKVKVAFGIRTNDDNKTYQTFLQSKFFGNGSKPGMDGEYAQVRKAIDKFKQDRPNAPVTFSALPIHEWKVSATEVKENDEDMPSFFDNGKDDLPFD